MIKYLLLVITASIVNYQQTFAFISTHTIAIYTSNYNRPIYFVDNKETDYASIRKLDVKSVKNIEYQKASEAVRIYGARARFGAVKITLRKVPLNLPKQARYSCTLYVAPDTGSNILQTYRFSDDLDSLLKHILKDYPRSNVVIDYLGYRIHEQAFVPLNEVAAAFHLIYTENNIDSLSLPLAEAVFYCSRKFQSGKVYFSGENFGRVIRCEATDKPCILQNLNRCTTNSIITFDACRYDNKDNVFTYLNKSIKL